jgi:hypothetical protein
MFRARALGPFEQLAALSEDDPLAWHAAMSASQRITPTIELVPIDQLHPDQRLVAARRLGLTRPSIEA